MRWAGILGGMGPEATVSLQRRILDFTPASGDADHIPVLVCNNPRIPDRTAAIRGEGPSPVPAMMDAARRLDAAGADFLVIPCNTAHRFLPELREAISLPILNLIEETASDVAGAVPIGSPVGILATDGTLMAGLYREVLAERGFQEVPPEPDEQREVMSAIYDADGIKAGGPARRHAVALGEIVRHLHQRGAQAVILGCTEIPLVFDAFPEPLPIPLISSIDALARAVIREAGARDPALVTSRERHGISSC